MTCRGGAIRRSRRSTAETSPRLKLAWRYGAQAPASGGPTVSAASQAIPIVVARACSTRPPRSAASLRSIRRPAVRSGSTISATLPPPTVACRTGPVMARSVRGSSPAWAMAACWRSTPPPARSIAVVWPRAAPIDLRAGVGRQVPEHAVPAALPRHRLQKPDHHRRARAGRQPGRPGHRRARVGSAHRKAGVDLPSHSAPGGTRATTPGRRTTG